MNNLNALLKRVKRLEKLLFKEPEYSLIRIEAETLNQLSEQDKNLLLLCATHIDESGSYVQLAKLTTRQNEALGPIFEKIDEIKASPLKLF